MKTFDQVSIYTSLLINTGMSMETNDQVLVMVGIALWD